MMVSSEIQVAPRTTLSSVAIVAGGPPVTLTLFSIWAWSRNAIHWPSGEMNGAVGAPVNTATGSSASSARTKSCVPRLPT